MGFFNDNYPERKGKNWGVGKERNPANDSGFVGDKDTRREPRTKLGAKVRGKIDSKIASHSPQKVKTICKEYGCAKMECCGETFDFHIQGKCRKWKKGQDRH